MCSNPERKRNISAKARNGGGDIQDVRLHVSIDDTKLKFSALINNKVSPAIIGLSIEEFINYLAKNSLWNLEINTILFREFIEETKIAFRKYYLDSFRIELSFSSYYLDERYFPSARKTWTMPDGKKIIGLEDRIPPFQYPEPNFLFVPS